MLTIGSKGKRRVLKEIDLENGMVLQVEGDPTRNSVAIKLLGYDDREEQWYMAKYLFVETKVLSEFISNLQEVHESLIPEPSNLVTQRPIRAR